jgi:hypothetical protein
MSRMVIPRNNTIGKYMKFIVFLLLVFGSMWVWNHYTVDPALNTPVLKPANAASAPADHNLTRSEALSQWLIDHTPAK